MLHCKDDILDLQHDRMDGDPILLQILLIIIMEIIKARDGSCKRLLQTAKCSRRSKKVRARQDASHTKPNNTKVREYKYGRIKKVKVKS